MDDGTSALALKRATNWLGSVAVPVGVLGQRKPGAALYATQLAFLKDQTSPAYYYSSPVNNGALRCACCAGCQLAGWPRGLAAGSAGLAWTGAACGARRRAPGRPCEQGPTASAGPCTPLQAG